MTFDIMTFAIMTFVLENLGTTIKLRKIVIKVKVW
jgi:hypothetical protein